MLSKAIGGSAPPLRLQYIATVAFVGTLLLLIYTSIPGRRHVAVTPPLQKDPTSHSLECHFRDSGIVMEVQEAVNRTRDAIADQTPDGPRLQKGIVTSPLAFYAHPFAPCHDSSKRAYATTLYDESYLPGALLLGYSLRKHGMLHPDIARHMLLLHIPGRLSDESLQLLRSVGWETVAVDRISVPEGKESGPEYKDQYTKLQLFELEEYDQIFYIDADALVVKSFPEIWSFPAPFAACRDIRIGTDTVWLSTINAGTLLLKPNRRLLAHMLEAAPFIEYEHWFAEQALLNAYWLRDMTFYPYIFNGQLDLKRGFPDIWTALKHDVRIVHYTWNKPWKCDLQVDQLNERREWLWEWEEMIEVRERQGLSVPDPLRALATTGFCAYTSAD